MRRSRRDAPELPPRVRTLITNARLLDPEKSEPDAQGCLLVEDGEIAARLTRFDAVGVDAREVDLAGLSLAPGFIDLHFHGELIFAEAADEIDAAFQRTSSRLVREGATAYLGTTVAWSRERIEGFMTHAAKAMTHHLEGAQCLGVHLEGPWIAAPRAGAQPPGAIRAFSPTDDRALIEAWADHIEMVTLAPELPESHHLLGALDALGIVASLGHSNASSEEIDAAEQFGLTHVTHLFNAMSPLHHRDLGVAGHVLTHEHLTADLICDGVHVHPRIVGLATRQLGDRLALITDRIEPPVGADFGAGRLVEDERGIWLPGGTLAGSALGMARAAQNAISFAEMTMLEAVRAATLTPARVLGVERERGTLRVGARADFVVLDDAGEVRQTWVGGRLVFDRARGSGRT